MTPLPKAIEATGLVKVYGEKRALDGVDLDVERGAVCALLGPNGAGKTTAVRVLTTLTHPDQGRASVAGHDVVQDPVSVRRVLGLAAQDATVDQLLTGFENLVMIGELHHLGRKVARERAGLLLEQFSLADAARKLAKEYSGGMRRRLDLAATLVNRPEVLFLDEPTTGLDPRARNELWDVLEGLVGDGATLLLTTQYLEEADRLADDIVVVDHGKVIARGDARSLKRQVGGDQLRVVVASRSDLQRVAGVVARVAGCDPVIDEGARSVVAQVASGGVAAVGALAEALGAEGVVVEDLGLAQPTLDDVFLTLTGRPPEDEGAGDDVKVPEEVAR
ncbi:daunorubicin resistance protein DrrA family ABC transporter ATP-binding protein [Conexibacter woesei]|uniref:daunorubicin resistance protein DrrA family ABC transporter ATP-binding protein n=1 Tax=Conexibacter woesei TaxID=191495 RepID=UPI00041BB116|nr:daunorubicin resistance protein DrrA family ABC transporter ATP-binding protein [Conexibacter woesei]